MVSQTGVPHGETAMKRVTVHCLLVLAGLMACSAGRAQARPPEIRAGGVWRGFFHSLDDPDLFGAVVFNLTDGPQQRQVTGMVTLVMGNPGFTLPFHLDGTVAASNEFTGTGWGKDGSKVMFHGEMYFFGTAAVIDARYLFMLARGGQDRGTAIALRSFVEDPELLPPPITGDYAGAFRSAVDDTTGGMSARFPQDPRNPTSFAALVKFDDEEFPQGLGTVNGAGEVVVIGMGSAGRYLLHGQASQPMPRGGVPPGPARVQGDYMIAFVDGTADNGRFDITQTVRMGR
jgi:hypothetical protein